jgi:hypothetical protein
MAAGSHVSLVLTRYVLAAAREAFPRLNSARGVSTTCGGQATQPSYRTKHENRTRTDLPRQASLLLRLIAADFSYFTWGGDSGRFQRVLFLQEPRGLQHSFSLPQRIR